MSEHIDFYFDFSSPYGYLAAEKIDELAARHGRKVRWRPVLLGVIFKTTGAAPLTMVPVKGEYSQHDFARSARFLGVPYQHPDLFPLHTVHAARAYYWLHDEDCARARLFARAVLRAYFTRGVDVSDLAVVQEIAAQHGADRDRLSAALVGTVLKERLRAECAAALAKGVFGSPYFIVDGEPFFGADRLPQVEHWLASGGF